MDAFLTKTKSETSQKEMGERSTCGKRPKEPQERRVLDCITATSRRQFIKDERCFFLLLLVVVYNSMIVL